MQDAEPTDLISIRDATKLVPSPRGKRTHISTIHRWIRAGKIEAMQRGRWLFVSRAAVMALLQPYQFPVHPTVPPVSRRVDPAVIARLKARGLPCGRG